MAQVVFRGTKAELRDLLRSIPAILAGRAPDPLGVARGVQLRVGVALLSQVSQDFVKLSRGGSTSWRGPWPPLKPETIARRRRSAGDRREARTMLKTAKALHWKRKPTAVQLYGYRDVQIGVDTARMFRSLSPGVEDQPSGADDQVFETPPGAAIVGSNVIYFERFIKGDPAGNQPPRPCWPQDGTVPAAWWPPVRDAGLRGVQLAILTVLRG